MACQKSLIRPTDWFIDQYEQLLTKYPPNERMAVWIAVGAPWTVTGDGLDKSLALSKRTGTPMVMHIGENWVDNHCSLDRFGMNSVPYLEKIGFLRPELLAIHCVTLNDEDIALFVKNDVRVSYNPVSNMYLGSGIPPMMKIQKAGLIIGLGVDGAGSNNSQDMIETLKVSALLQKVAAGDASVVNAQQILDWATLGGAKIFGLEDQIGSIEVGKVADLFAIAPNSAKVVPIHDPVASLVYSCGQENVELTIANGVILMEDKIIQHLDEETIIRKCQEISLGSGRKMWIKFQSEKILERNSCMRGLKGKVACITGAAQGIGQEICVRLAEEGTMVFALDILNTEKTIQRCLEIGGKAEGKYFDVTNKNLIQDVINQII